MWPTAIRAPQASPPPPGAGARKSIEARQARLQRMMTNNSDYQLFMRQAQAKAQAKRSAILIMAGVTACVRT